MKDRIEILQFGLSSIIIDKYVDHFNLKSAVLTR